MLHHKTFHLAEMDSRGSYLEQIGMNMWKAAISL